MEVFELLFLGVEEPMNQSERIDANITWIEMRTLRGTDRHSFLKKGNDTQVSVKEFSPWWMLLDIQSTVNFIMNKEIVKETCNARGRFFCVHCNVVIRIIRMEAILPGFRNIWLDNRCIANIISLSEV